MKNIYFVSGIDTGCGKTYITGKLADQIRKSGKRVITHKLIQTGCQGVSEDILEHRRLVGMDLLEEDKSGLTCPYVFSFPASPHYASKLENKQIDLDKVQQSLQVLSENYDVVLCEGAGGIMVPLTEKVRTIDFIKTYDLPLILVASSRLGGLNHAMLTLEACFSRGLNLKRVIFNQFPLDDPGMAKDMYDYLEQYLYDQTGEEGLLSFLDEVSLTIL